MSVYLSYKYEKMNKMMTVGMQVCVIECSLSSMIALVCVVIAFCSSAIVNFPVNIARFGVNCSGGEERITDCSIVQSLGSSCPQNNQFHLNCCKPVTHCVINIMKQNYINLFFVFTSNLTVCCIVRSSNIDWRGRSQWNSGSGKDRFLV